MRKSVLDDQIKEALLSQRNLALYYLGIAGIELIRKDIALGILQQRRQMNRKIIEEIKRIFQKRGGSSLPLEARALFEHPVLLVESDNRFLEDFVKELRRENHGQNGS